MYMENNLTYIKILTIKIALKNLISSLKVVQIYYRTYNLVYYKMPEFLI